MKSLVTVFPYPIITPTFPIVSYNGLIGGYYNNSELIDLITKEAEGWKMLISTSPAVNPGLSGANTRLADFDSYDYTNRLYEIEHIVYHYDKGEDVNFANSFVLMKETKINGCDPITMGLMGSITSGLSRVQLGKLELMLLNSGLRIHDSILMNTSNQRLISQLNLLTNSAFNTMIIDNNKEKITNGFYRSADDNNIRQLKDRKWSLEGFIKFDYKESNILKCPVENRLYITEGETCPNGHQGIIKNQIIDFNIGSAQIATNDLMLNPIFFDTFLHAVKGFGDNYAMLIGATPDYLCHVSEVLLRLKDTDEFLMLSAYYHKRLRIGLMTVHKTNENGYSMNSAIMKPQEIINRAQYPLPGRVHISKILEELSGTQFNHYITNAELGYRIANMDNWVNDWCDIINYAEKESETIKGSKIQLMKFARKLRRQAQ